jgi:TatA/E family protein of Tat protein translocase
MRTPSFQELLLIGLFAVLFFGKDKIVDLAKSIGQAGNELKKGFEGEEKVAKTKKSSSKKS